MNKYSIDIAEPAVRDIAEIRSYISSYLQEPGSAGHVYDRIKKAILSLETTPERNPVVREEPYRQMRVRRIYAGNYTIFYIADKKRETVSVLRVLYSRRDWKAVLDEEGIEEG